MVEQKKYMHYASVCTANNVTKIVDLACPKTVYENSFCCIFLSMLSL